MVQLNALQLTETVRERLVSFSADDAFVHDQQLAAICRRLWSGPPEHGGLVSNLWVEGAFPAKQSDQTLNTLTQAGHFSRELRDHLDRNGVFPAGRPLYTHQAEAVLEAARPGPQGEQPAVVVTAGTGAGKTEAFVLPLLNDLFTRPDHGAPGIKCLILYPMNALVNDQVGRLDNWLKGQTKVTLFHFTSETPENKQRADAEDVKPWGPHRMRTRQEARGLETHEGRPVGEGQTGRTPDIVITNYSMLEYMLCRPQDSVFFGPGLRAVVLDEAHLYTGTLAAEITLLLRRLLIRCGLESRHVLHMAASATLSGDKAELATFAAGLFSKDAAAIRLIEGEPTPVTLDVPSPPTEPPSAAGVASETWLDHPLLISDAAGETQLAVDADLCAQLQKKLPLLVGREIVQRVPRDELHPAVLLRQTLGAAPIVHRLANILWDQQRVPLNQLAADLWGAGGDDEVRATIALLQLAASARTGATDYPLLPHRIHFMTRPTEGLSVCLDPACPAPAAEKLAGLGAVAAGLEDRCGICGQATLALYRCTNCGEWVLAGVLDQRKHQLRPAPLWPVEKALQLFTVDLDGPPTNKSVAINPTTGELSGVGGRGIRARSVEGCPHCDEERDRIRPFSTGAPLALSIVAETVLAELPPYASATNSWLPAQGRRLLAFSDSRPEAARLGVRLTRQHELQVVRTAILHALRLRPAVDDDTIAYFREQLNQVEQRLQQPGLSAALRRNLDDEKHKFEGQLRTSSVGGSMNQWVDALNEVTLLAQVLDRDSGNLHNARTWALGHQEQWEKNRQEVQNNVLVFLAREFARPFWGAPSLETLGLAEITYPGIETIEPPASFLGVLPDEAVRQTLERCWTDLLAALCDTLRMDGAITTSNRETDQAYEYGGVTIGRWAAETEERGSRLIRFVGATPRQRRLEFAAAVLQRAGLEEQTAKDLAPNLLRAVFQQLWAQAGPVDGTPPAGALRWLRRQPRQTRNDGPLADAIQIVFPELGLRRPLKLYQCGQTRLIWPRSVRGCAPAKGCNGTLTQVSDAELDGDMRAGRQRREYQDSPAFQVGLWSEEHSAQLAPQENRRLQDLFKAGIRNVLSATTTLELGIDIGGLNGVLMSNVPPGNASYLQRAGRAGRRADGSSVVVTFARTQPFDRAVFQRIGDYLGKKLRRPRIFLDRERVVRRHLHAFLLGQFFQQIYPPGFRAGAMNAYGNMGSFCGVPQAPRWERGQASKPSLIQPLPLEQTGTVRPSWWNPALQAAGLDAHFSWYLGDLRDSGEPEIRPIAERLLRDSSAAGQLRNWATLLDSIRDNLAQAVKTWRDDYDALLRAWTEIGAQAQPGALRQANAIRYQLRLLYETTVIEALADRQFLPHYGFPIGLQKLRVLTPDDDRGGAPREEDQYRLERGSLLALREYVPGSQLLVGGKLITSHGLLKHWTGANIDTALGLRGQYCICLSGHTYYWLSLEPENCTICGAVPKQSPQALLFPKAGFSGAAWDPPKWSASVERVGTVQTATMTFTQRVEDGSGAQSVDNFASIPGLRASYREAGELLVFNAGDNEKGFAICLKCGYADSETKVGDGRVGLPRSFVEHQPLSEQLRWRRPCLRDGETPLRNQTLAARETTDVLLLDFSDALPAASNDEALMTTLGYALVRAGAELLELDSRELGVMTAPAGKQGSGLGVVLYDATPGGAGHVRELMSLGRGWLQAARDALFVNEEHDRRCQTACLDCLLSFDAQAAAQRGLLNRPLALAKLAQLLDGEPPPPPPLAGPSPTPVMPATADRLRAADQRRTRQQ